MQRGGIYGKITIERRPVAARCEKRRGKGRRSPALEQLPENDADSYEIVEVGDIQVDDLLLSAEEYQAMLAQGETPDNWESESSQVS